MAGLNTVDASANAAEKMAASSQADAYDEVTYPNFAFPQTHPDRLASLATLFGMRPARVDRCRVLELACGDGGNLIPMALDLPDSEFLGLDRAPRPITKGQAVIRALALKNIQLTQLDIGSLNRRLGQFDYIIAHGLYSWVPPEVQDRILSICGSCLSPQGVAYISYNTYPGCHLRKIVRELLLFHTKDVSDTRERIAQARALINWLAEAQSGKNAYQSFLREVRKHFDEKSAAAIYHDDLANINAPVYFHQFIQQAAKHGLQFLSEAEYFDPQYSELPSAVSEQLRLLSEQDVHAREQYLDFLEGRSFRQTLLCHHDVVLDRAIKPELVHQFNIKAEVHSVSAKPDLGSEAVEEFRGKDESAIATSFPLAKAALVCLGEVYPHSLRFDELLAEALRRIGPTAVVAESPLQIANLRSDVQVGAISEAKSEISEALAALLLKAYGAGVVEMHLHAPRFNPAPAERPIASPLARLQAEAGPIITTLLHNNVKLEDDLGLSLLLLLDGTRDRAALLKELTAIVESAGECSGSAAATIAAKEKFLRTLPEQLEDKLTELAQLGLLLA